jgi:hypothetical protein
MKALQAFWESVRITSSFFLPALRCSAGRARLVLVVMLVISIGALSEHGLAQSSKPDVQIQVERQNQKKPLQLALSFPEPCEYPDETHSFPYSSVCGWEAEFAYQVGYSYEDGDIHTSFRTVAGQTCDAWMTANANQDSKPIVEDLGSYFPFTPPWQRRGLYRGKEYKDFTGTQRLQIQAYGCLPLDGEIVIAASWGNIIAGSHAIARLGWMYKQAATAFTEQAKGLPVKVAEFRPTTPAPKTAQLQATVQAAAEPKPAAAPVKQAPVALAAVQAKSAPAPAAAPTLAKAAAEPVAPASKASVQTVAVTTSRTIMLPIIGIPVKLSAEASRWRLPEKDEGTGLKATLSNGEDLVVFFGRGAYSGCAGFIDASIKGGTEQDPKNPPVALSKPSYLPDSWYGRVARDKSLTIDSACLVTAQGEITAGISVDWDGLAKGPKPGVDEATALLRALLESVASSLGVGAPAKEVAVAAQRAAPPVVTEAAGSSSSTPVGTPVAAKPSGAYFNPSAHALILPTKSGDVSIGVPADMTVVKVETPKSDVTTIGLTSSAGNVQLFLIDVPSCSSWNEQNRKVKEGRGLQARVIPRESGLLDQRWFSPAYFSYITYLNEQDLEGCLDHSGGGSRMIIRDFRNILPSDITQFSVNIASAFPGTAAPVSQASTSVDSAIPLFLLNAARQCKQGMSIACELVGSIQPIMASCNRGQDAIDGQECYSIAEMASSSKDREAAQTYYKRACELGYKKACKKAK